MLYPLKSSFSRAMGLLGLLALGVVQGGCAHPVFVEPSVSVHSRVGHFPVHAQVGMPSPVIYAPPPRVIYMPPPPPRVVYAPQVRGLPYGPHATWGHGQGHRHPDHDRSHTQRDERGDRAERGEGRGEGRWGRRQRDDERR